MAGILDALHEAGYRARWCLLGACAVGACHHRHRFFLVAEQATGAPERVALAKCGAPRRKAGMLPTPLARDGHHRGEGGPEYWQRRRDELGRPNGMPLMLPTPRASDGRKGGPNQHGRTGDLMLPSAVIGERFGPYAPAIAQWAEAHGEPPAPTEPNRSGAMRLSPGFAEWMMGLPPGWVTGHVGRVPALRMLGNGVLPLQAAAALRACVAPRDGAPPRRLVVR